MGKIIRLINKKYKKIYKVCPEKTKRSRYLYGRDIYKNLDKKEKSRIKKVIRIYYPDIKVKSKKYQRISRDLVFSKRFYKCDYNEYFMFDFYHKNDAIRKTFITGVQKKDYIHMYNTDDAIKLFRNKYETYKMFKDLYKRDVIEITCDADYKEFEEFITKHPKFIKKSNNLSCGKSIEIINSDDKNKKELFSKFLNESDSTVLEELVVQAEETAVFHPESVNTIRIITFKDLDGEIKIKYPFLRVGVGSSIVDNGGAGGLICLIDEKTGKIITDGVSEKRHFYKYHPDTCIEIKGYQIPDWDDALNLAKEAQKRIDDARLIGWDLAYTNNGWVLIEGNGHTQFIGQQIADQIGKKVPFEKMIHYKERKNKLLNNEKEFTFSVIIPIYNAEKYLEETINSVISQTIGFENNIELILVNDGSTDSSEEICQKYEKMFPNNIKYIKQKNSGVSSARNTGMKHITGKYVNFLDSDDKWSLDAFSKVQNFFEERNSKIDFVTCRQKFFEGKSGYPNQDYKFKEAKSYIVNIDKNPDYIVLSVSSTFFKTRCLKNREFDTRLNYGEDAKFITEILLESEKYGLVKDAIFYLRKRNDNTSLTQNSNIDITKFTNTIEYYYDYLIKLSKEKYNMVIPYIQYVVINGLKYRVSNQLPDILEEKTKKKYINTIEKLLKDIDDEVIIKTRNINMNIRYYLFKQKYKNDKNTTISEDKNIIYNNISIGKLNGSKKLYISSINIINNKLVLRGLYKFPLYLNTDNVTIKINDKKHTLKFDETNKFNKLSYKDEIITEIKTFNLTIDNISDINEKEAYFIYDNHKISLNIEIDNDDLLKNINNNYVKINKYMVFKLNKQKLIIKKMTLPRLLTYKFSHK